ncbi:hypothetical protein DSCW_27490 [Desulfosarcina widdelii]|uniref:Spermidine synthase n=1 Tax=Desulfosarcina widdelii TaxID=947919 RepID=A0A5K7Z036_9BACT|nr:fused MFS/spermidine synthase [Desulfosarcina widdelii]BBO75332.1 hypothetical protein DSCW_27490 [Desulfosarcina widdelii]
MLSLFVAGCFFLSGMAGLVYEVIWVRLIETLTGGAPFAVATVLCVFMAGMALGSYLAGHVVDRLSGRGVLLSLYGLLEIGIGVCAVAVPFMIQAAAPLYQTIYSRLPPGFWGCRMAAFLGFVLILAVPAGLMGAALPVLCRFYVLRLDHVGARTGLLYGLNTAGAALGVILCGFLLIETLGVSTTLGMFACLNILIGLSCIAVSRFAAGEGSRPAEPLEPVLPNPRAKNSAFQVKMRWGVSLFAVSGFCAMAYEVFWTRLLGLVAGPTTYCFTLVVATFIVGLAAGSLLFSCRADHVGHPLIWLAGTQAAAFLTALGVSQLLGNGQFVFARLDHAFPSHFLNLVPFQAIVSFGLMLVPTLFLGAAFPLVNRLCIQTLADTGRSVGTAYALNTVGGLLGSFVAGFVLIPWLGEMNGLRLILSIQFLAAGFALLDITRLEKSDNRIRLAVVGLMGVGLLLVAHYPSLRTDLLFRIG